MRTPDRRTLFPAVAMALAVFAGVAAAADGERGAVLRALAALALAAGTHWSLRRIGLRLPAWLARRCRRTLPESPDRWAAVFEVAVFAAKVVLWIAATLYVTEQFPAVQARRRELVAMGVRGLTAPLFVLNDRPYTAIDVLELPAVFGLLVVVVNAVTRVFTRSVLGATGVDRGVQNAVGLIARYTLLFLGAVVLLQVWGISASSLTFAASALGIGIGFGLQHIANNFVSGLVISLERPVQPGDFVRVGEWQGTVESVGSRHTEIRTLDNVSILVPNSKFLETEVVNWTHGDPVARLHVPVGVAYGSDLARVRSALLDAARDHPDVLDQPPPRVHFLAFGDSALQFDLLVWTRDPRIQQRLVSDLNYRIAANLRQHRVQVPFPQRDLHLRSPELSRLLRAWAPHTSPEADLAVADDAAPIPPLTTTAEHDEEIGPERWSEPQVNAVLARLRGTDGVQRSDRRHLVTVYRDCFVGREAVDWLVHHCGLTRHDAVVLGQRLMDRGDLRHVVDERRFGDERFFYRFTDGRPAAAAACA